MFFAGGATGAIKSAVTQARAQAAKKPKSKPKKSSKGATIFGLAKDLTDLKIGGNQKTPSSSMAGAVHKIAKDATKKKKTQKSTAKKVAKKIAGSSINPGSAAINL